MIGRQAEAADLRAWATSGVACVVGAPGMGKSLLLTELASQWAAEGDVVLHVRGTDSAKSIPWGALRTTPAGAWLPEEQTDPAALADALERHMAPDVLVVDEVHVLDAATRDWVRHMAASGQLPMLLAWRAGELDDPALLTALADRGARTRTLSGLPRQGIRALAEDLLGPVADSLVRALEEHTAGNPLLIRSALDQWRAEGLLSEAGVARLTGPATTPAPVAEAALARVSALDPRQSQALLAVAMSEPIALGLISQVIAVEVLERCEAAGLVQVQAQGDIEVLLTGHPTLARAARVKARPEHLVEVASALLVLDDPQVSVVQRGQWQLLAPVSDPKAVSTLIAAAEEARRFLDHPLATRLAEEAISRGAGARARLVLVEIDMSSGNWRGADTTLVELAEEAGDDDERVLVANAHAYVLGQLGEVDRAWEVLRAASAAVGAGHRAPLQVRSAINRLFEAEATTALDLAAPLLGDPDQATRARACYAAAIAHALCGDVEAATVTAERGEQAFVGLVPVPAVTRIGPALAGLLAGRVPVARAQAQRLLEAMLAAGDREGEATGTFLLGRVALESADPGEAGRLFRASLSAATEIGDAVAVRWARGGLLHALALAGDPGRQAEAQHLADELEREPAAVRLFEDDVVLRGLAQHRAAQGDVVGAIRELTVAAEAAAMARPAVAGLLITDAVLLEASSGPATRSDDPDQPASGSAVAGSWAGPERPSARAVREALDGSDGRALDQLWTQVDGAGAAFLAGRIAAAAATSQAHGSRAAARWRTRAAVVAAMPPWATAAPARPNLSPRQREIAARAARGATSAEIAAELGLSVRTVDNHLQAVYRALGVRTRTDLAAVLLSN